VRLNSLDFGDEPLEVFKFIIRSVDPQSTSSPIGLQKMAVLYIIYQDCIQSGMRLIDPEVTILNDF
jgi:hypothetical protein